MDNSWWNASRIRKTFSFSTAEDPGGELAALVGAFKAAQAERANANPQGFRTTVEGVAAEVESAIEARRAAKVKDPFRQPVVITRQGKDAQKLRDLILQVQKRLESTHGWRVELRSDWYGGQQGTTGHTMEYTLHISPDGDIPAALQPLVSEYVDALIERSSPQQSADDRFVELAETRLAALTGYYESIEHRQALSVAHQLVTGDDPRTGLSLLHPDPTVHVIDGLMDTVQARASEDCSTRDRSPGD